MFDKRRSHFLGVELVQDLKFLFVFHRPDQGAAITLVEKTLQQPADPIFVLDFIGQPFLLGESVLEIFFWGDLDAVLVLHLEREISDDPHESWEVLVDLLLEPPIGSFHLNFLSEIYDQ